MPTITKEGQTARTAQMLPENPAEKENFKDLQMIHVGLKRWDTEPTKELVLKAVNEGLRAGSIRNRLIAARIVAILEKQNQVDEIESRKPRAVSHQHIHIENQAASNDPEYVEFKRLKALKLQSESNQNGSRLSQLPPPA